MKKIILTLIFGAFASIGYSQIYFRETINNEKVSSYHISDIEMLRRKYKLPTAFGYTKTVTENEDKVYETLTIFYKLNGEVMEKRVISKCYIVSKPIQNTEANN
jgi:hypothetical protein